MKRIVIGTAGHVDHGKTTLTKKLTGINTDRLSEEQKRGISIELGFAPLQLKPDLVAGIVDVPGHEKFIKTMLAGVAGIDLVLLIIAADEGVMPQTTEHLDIITLLGVEKGIVVITKTDLVDQEWLELIKAEVTEALSATPLAQSPMVAVSAATDQGIDQLLEAICQMAETIPAKSSLGQARMPIDRSFSVTGFGTVATGTLWSGELKLGEYLELFPSEQTGRIRSLQAHGQKQDTARAGQRIAVNLAGIEKADAPKGGWLAEAGLLKPSYRLDVELTLLASAKELIHHARLRIHHGTAEVLGRIHFLDRESLKPSENCLAQLTLESPLPPLRDDRLVIRSYSPMHTIAGATVIDNLAPRHKRYQPQIMADLAKKAAGRPEDLLLQALDQSKKIILSQGALQKATGLTLDQTTAALANLIAENQIINLADDAFISVYRNHKLCQASQEALTAYHKKYPLRIGLPKEELRSKILGVINQKSCQLLLSLWQQTGLINQTSEAIALSTFTPEATPELSKWQAKTEATLLDAPFSPPSWQTLVATLPQDLQGEVLFWLVGQGTVIKLQEDIVFHQEAINQALDIAKTQLEQTGELTLGVMRDLLNTSRKYALAFLDYLDNKKITKRQGDIRVKY